MAGKGEPSMAVQMMQMKMGAEEAGHQMNYAALQILDNVDGLHIKQEWEILEQISSWYEQKNEYTVFDKTGKTQLFKVKESTCCCYRVCCGENRPFRLKVYDTTGDKDKVAMVFKRRYRCCGCAIIPCCAHRVDVHYMVDKDNNSIGHESDRTLISRVQVPMCHGGCCIPTWRVQDREGRTQANIHGPCCMVCDCCGADFTLSDKEGRKTGSITKLRPDTLKGMAMEIVTEADNFRLKFEKDLDPTIKMALLAATLQIDFSFFEDKRGICEGRFCDIWCCGWACPCVPACLCCCCKDKHDKKNAKDRRGAPAAEEMSR